MFGDDIKIQEVFKLWSSNYPIVRTVNPDNPDTIDYRTIVVIQSYLRSFCLSREMKRMVKASTLHHPPHS
jgi:hypothetical protein